MAYHASSQYIGRRIHDRVCNTGYPAKLTEQLCSSKKRHSRYADDENDRPRRRRWAAGYIDRSSCPSHAYISTRRRSPDSDFPSDTEYIVQSRRREDDCIEAHEQHDTGGHRHATYHPEAGRSRYSTTPPKRHLQDQRRDYDAHPVCYGSDVEDLPTNPNTPMHTTLPKSHDSDTGHESDIVIVHGRHGGSDIASIHSRCSSRSQSDRYSVTSLSMQSQVQDTKRSDDESESDDEGCYISLDDYIIGRCDCVSNQSLSEGEGEGSDAVGSDVEEASSLGEEGDVACGSDVAFLSDNGYFDDDEDCIGDGKHQYASRER